MSTRKRKTSVPNPCSECGLPIFGSTIGTGDGSMKDGGSFAHPECYWRMQANKGSGAIVSCAKIKLFITLRCGKNIKDRRLAHIYKMANEIFKS